MLTAPLLHYTWPVCVTRSATSGHPTSGIRRLHIALVVAIYYMIRTVRTIQVMSFVAMLTSDQLQLPEACAILFACSDPTERSAEYKVLRSMIDVDRCEHSEFWPSAEVSDARKHFSSTPMSFRSRFALVDRAVQVLDDSIPQIRSRQAADRREDALWLLSTLWRNDIDILREENSRLKAARATLRLENTEYARRVRQANFREQNIKRVFRNSRKRHRQLLRELEDQLVGQDAESWDADSNEDF